MPLFRQRRRIPLLLLLLLAEATSRLPCSLAWTNSIISSSTTTTTSEQHQRSTIISLHAYLDDDSSSSSFPLVNGNSRAAAAVTTTTAAGTAPPAKTFDDEDATPSTSSSSSSFSAQDFTGAGTLGDIMSRDLRSTSDDFTGLVTTNGGVLHQMYGIQSPLDRMAVTANGNLQRLFSSYYDAPVHVVVDKCVQSSSATSTDDDGKMWDRIVHLRVFDTTFCTATSTIVVHDVHCRALVQSGTVGLGQLFRHLDKLPSFSLVDAGYGPKGGLWRRYKLECYELSCHIREEFIPEMWNIQP